MFKEERSSLFTRDSLTPIFGYRTVKLTGVNPITGRIRVITLSDTVYSPGFYLSLVLFSKLCRTGAKWDINGDCIRDSLGNAVISLYKDKRYGLWTFDQPTREELYSKPLPVFHTFSTLPT